MPVDVKYTTSATANGGRPPQIVGHLKLAAALAARGPYYLRALQRSEAVELGATAHFMVDGEWNDDLMTQVQAPTPIG